MKTPDNPPTPPPEGPRKLFLNKPRSEFITRLITRDEWKWICKLREGEICSRKTRFPTKDSALAEIVRRMTQMDTECPRLNTYECPSCNGWHLTSQAKTNFKPPTEKGAP
jgi:hypothetical protein